VQRRWSIQVFRLSQGRVSDGFLRRLIGRGRQIGACSPYLPGSNSTAILVSLSLGPVDACSRYLKSRLGFFAIPSWKTERRLEFYLLCTLLGGPSSSQNSALVPLAATFSPVACLDQLHDCRGSVNLAVSVKFLSHRPRLCTTCPICTKCMVSPSVDSSTASVPPHLQHH
jgi:hypothetical protein